MAKKRIGRPKLAKGAAKGSVITVRLTKEERKRIGAAAVRDGTSRLSEWIRDRLLAAAASSKIEVPESEDVGIEPHGGTGRGLGV